jgi:predicted alpha-1,6-mannanase (GH76 family)
MAHAETAALPLLFKWYNLTSGLWDTTDWWESANTMTTLGDLVAINPNAKDSVNALFANTFAHAPNTHRDFLNDYYDDEGWWALAWITAYDITQKPEYLQTAVAIFEDMTGGWGTPCGGIWWHKTRTGVFAIANELFFSVAASLANRNSSNQAYYLDWAHRSRHWFENSGLVNAQGLVNDGLNLTTCENDGDTIWSYNQGVILGAYVELAKADPSVSNLTHATSLALAAIRHLSDPQQILHDVCEPSCDNTAAQFKGVFMRNLRILQQQRQQQHASPQPDLITTFIRNNADSIWAHDRITTTTPSDGEEVLFGQVWSGPFVAPANATTQSAALDALIAAAAVADSRSSSAPSSNSGSTSSTPQQSTCARSLACGPWMWSLLLSVLLFASLLPIWRLLGRTV